MNIETRRFFVLNAIINGHGIMDACENDISLASSILMLDKDEKSQREAKKIIDGIDNLYKNGKTLESEYHIITRVVLNYFRVNDYAYIHVPGQPLFYLSAIAEGERTQQIEAGLGAEIAMRTIMDIGYVRNPADTHISDGKLYIIPSDEAGLRQYIQDAYHLFFMGTTPERDQAESNKVLTILNNRNLFYMGQSKSVSATAFKKTIKTILDAGWDPRTYSRTFLKVSDLMDVYRSTGTLLMRDPADSEHILWMLDVVGGIRYDVKTVKLSDLRDLMINSLKDLSNLHCKSVGGQITVKEAG